MDFTPEFIKCLSLLPPKDDLRKYLNGVNVDFRKGRFEITNGHFAVVITLTNETDKKKMLKLGKIAKVDSIVIPKADLITISKNMDENKNVCLKYENNQWFLNNIGFIPTKGTYPNFEQFRTNYGVKFLSQDEPDYTDVKPDNGGINLFLLSNIEKALKHIAKLRHFVSIHPKYDNQIVIGDKRGMWFEIHGCSENYAIDLIMMPSRGDK